jgi:hypothetical protein
MRNLLILFTLCFFSLMSHAGTIDPNTPDETYIKYGEDFKYVGTLCGQYKNRDFFCASAVAIDDFNILTAAHVVNDVDFCIFTLNELSVHCINNIIIHKDFKSEKTQFADIAIGYSKTSFKLKFYPPLYTENNEKSKLCCIAGYGFHGTFLSGSNKHDGLKRAGSNIIDNIEKDLLICSPSKRKDKTFTSLEFLIASGDSGGGLFIDGKLAGINSCVIAIGRNPSSKYDEESGHTRISNFIEWINDNRKQ